jgi:2-phospho-L-lactate guanylyltransferase
MDTPLPWSIVIPVKVLARAKSRLTALAGARRGELALAMAADTVAAAVACAAGTAPAGTVIVVTDDAAVAAELAGLDAVVLPDEPAAGLNPALEFGAAHAAARWPDRGIAALAADLPALRPAELTAALAAAARLPEAFVADAAGTGTTLYTAGPQAAFCPRFGPGSRDKHRLAGAVQLDLSPRSGLRRDVDTPADLRQAAQIGLGTRTAAVAAQLACA